MFKMIFTLASFLFMALVVLALRHQRLELTAQVARLHDDVMEKQWLLRDQVVAISKTTNPIQLTKHLQNQGLIPTPATQPQGPLAASREPLKGTRTSAYAMDSPDAAGDEPSPHQGRHETP